MECPRTPKKQSMKVTCNQCRMDMKGKCKSCGNNKILMSRDLCFDCQIDNVRTE